MWETWPQYQKFSWEISLWYYLQLRENDLYFVKTQTTPHTYRDAHKDTHISLWILGTSQIYERLGKSLHQDHDIENMIPWIWGTLFYCLHTNNPYARIFMILVVHLKISIPPFLESLNDIAKLHLGLFG